MAAEVALSVPTIRVNNDVVGIVPNSFKYNSGKGEKKVKAASTGGGNVETVHTQDAETMVGKVKFAMYPTAKNIAFISDWQESLAANTVEAVQRGDSEGNGDFSVIFKNMSVTNDPDINCGADGQIEVEMAGDPLD